MDGDRISRLRSVGASLRHDSARKHTSGEAIYADDIPEPPGLLHGALVLSPVAHGRLLELDTAPALAVPGVVAVLGPADIPGENDISSSGKSVEPLFPTDLVEHWGQALALVLGETRDAALAGAAAIKPRIAPLQPVLSIEEALHRGQLLRAACPASSAAAGRSTSTWKARSRWSSRVKTASRPSSPRRSTRRRCSTSSAACWAATTTASRSNAGAWAAASAARRATPPGSLPRPRSAPMPPAAR
jgi:xanthine dehydrogenase molybdopterin-binding subunit B